MFKYEKRQRKSIGFILALIMIVTAFAGGLSKNSQLAYATEDEFINLISEEELVVEEKPLSQEIPVSEEELLVEEKPLIEETPAFEEEEADNNEALLGITPFAVEEFDPFLFLTGVTMTDQNGAALPNPTPDTTKLRIEYKYALPDKTIINTTDTYFVTSIPAELEILENLIIPLTQMRDEVLVTVGNVFIGVDKQVTIKFEKDINDVDYLFDRTGFFYLFSTFDKEEVDGKDKIDFDLGDGTIITVPVTTEKEKITRELKLEKFGSYDEVSNVITWTIKVKPNSTPVNNSLNDVVIKDLIELGQTYIADSATILPLVANGTFELVGDSLNFVFNQPINTKVNDDYTITFKTKPELSSFDEEDKKIIFKNQAEGTYAENDGSVKSKSAEVATVVDFINKSGKYVSKTQTITWTININNNNLDLNQPVITDIIPAGLTLNEDSVKLNGTAVFITNLAGPLTYVGTALKYEFEGAVNTKQTLTFTTKVTDPDVFYDNVSKKFSNTGSITGIGIPDGATGTGIVGVTSSLIEKTGDSYNTKTRELTWKVSINKNLVTIKGAKFEDVILEGQKFVEGSFILNNVALTDLEVGDPINSNKLSYVFPTDISTEQTIIFKTYVTDPDVYAGNISKDYKNTATLTGTNIQNSSSIGTIKVNSQVVDKAGAGYDYVTREITWKVIVNKNGLPLNNSKFKDVIDPKLEFVAGSVTIDGVSALPGSYNYDAVSKTLTVEFGAQIDKQIVVTFKTKVIDLTLFKSNGDKTLKNTATFVADGINPVSNEGTQTIKSNVAEKKGNYEKKTNFIDWTVLINRNQLSIPSPALEDKLQAGLVLDLASIKLQKVIVNSDYSFIATDEFVPISIDNIVYDKDTNTFTFKFLKDINSAYLLSFSTDIDDAYSNTTFTNTINFKGEAVNQNSNSGNITVSFQAGGGGATGGTRGSITLTKKDMDDKTKLLPNVEFELLDKFGNVIKSLLTDENGVVVFDKLVLDSEYTVREVKPLNGYLPLGKEIKFTPKFKNKNLELEVLNMKIRSYTIYSDLEIIKRGEEELLFLPGAVFELIQGNQVVYTTEPTDKDGRTILKNVEYGFYTIREKIAPIGYNLSPLTQELYVTINGARITKIFENSKIEGTIQVKKIDNENNKLLAGAVFELLQNNVVIATSTNTDENGLTSFKNVEFGVYTLREKTAPVGYFKTSEVQTVVISENNKTYELTVNNTKIKGKLILTKVNEDGEVLEDAVFEVRDEEGKVVDRSTTDANGLITVDNLVYGKYSVVEIEAPDTYMLDETIFEFNISENQQIINLSFVNKRVSRLPDTQGKDDDKIGSNDKSDKNDKQPQLPSTGSSTVIPFYLGGLLLMYLGMVTLFRRRKTLK